mmetsp:Transcript_24478/g.63570  ORF Transcript_24478/g.63570 Transcript_24478/m.63570 type:complete len:569 (+) Transcript_24478:148-1854(+)
MISGCARSVTAPRSMRTTQTSQRQQEPARCTSRCLPLAYASAPRQQRRVATMATSRPDQVQSSERVSVPSYKVEDLQTGIVHFGIGNFARSHQMSYMEELLCRDFESHKGWAYTGAGVRASSGKKKEKSFGEQGNRYCIFKSNGDRSKQEVQVVGAIREILTGPLSPGELLKRITSEDTRIVSMTITEKGYATPFSDEDKKMLELAKSGKGDSIFTELEDNAKDYDGATAMGYIIAGLAARRALGHGGITIMSCDNIPKNGEHLTEKIMDKLESVDCDLRKWVEENCSFPNCMIDSITPSTDDEVIAELEANFGIKDNVPVPREFFKQWVIEDKFVAGRPAWEDVGAQMVEDVYPYEVTKIRMLNVGHTILALAGSLKDIGDSPTAAKDASIAQLYKGIFENEIRPVLEDVPGMDAIDLQCYQEQLVERFTEGLPDDLGRMLQDTFVKLRIQMVPAIIAGYKAGLDMRGLACTVACWGHYIGKIGGSGEELQDPCREALTKAVADGGIEKLLDNEEVFQELVSNKEWREAVTSSYNTIKEDGVDAAIEAAYPSGKSAKQAKTLSTASA